MYKPEIVVKWFAEHGIFAVPEWRFDAQRKWRFDFVFSSIDLKRPHAAWMPMDAVSEAKLALEVQGGLFIPGGGRHSRGPALLKEHEKLNAAACAGWRVLYTTPDQICFQETVDMVREALGI